MAEEPLHAGVLISGATGRVFWIRDDDDTPKEILHEEQEDLLEGAQAFAEGRGNQFMTMPLPEELFQLLDAAFGPLAPNGVVHHKTFHMGGRS